MTKSHRLAYDAVGDLTAALDLENRCGGGDSKYDFSDEDGFLSLCDEDPETVLRIVREL